MWLRPASATAVHPSAPANGIDSATTDPAIVSPITEPPRVAAGRDSRSPRKNQYMPSPASSGLSVIISPSAREHDVRPNSSMTGT